MAAYIEGLVTGPEPQKVIEKYKSHHKYMNIIVDIANHHFENWFYRFLYILCCSIILSSINIP